jgi:hypothetical protein
VGDVTDRREQCRVHHRGTDAEEGGAEHRGRKARGAGDLSDRDGLGEHVPADEPFAADAVGEGTGDELPEAPDRGLRTEPPIGSIKP